MSDVTQESPNMKTIGGLILEDLYWEFKTAYTSRHEKSAEALEHAIRMYVDLDKEKGD